MMKVLLVNGSSHAKGCTFTALSEVAGALQAEGIETEIISIGSASFRGCINCGKCSELKRCVFDDDCANTILQKAREADGLVIGSPVYYAGPNGALCAILDRVFYASAGTLAGKPAAAIVNCRRGGASAAFDRLNKYFTISKMPVVSSQYWNSTHGFTPTDVKKDLEGMQVMRTLGTHMAWMLKSIKNAGLPLPAEENRVWTNFII